MVSVKTFSENIAVAIALLTVSATARPGQAREVCSGQGCALYGQGNLPSNPSPVTHKVNKRQQGGSVILIGGALADDNAEVYERIVSLGGGENGRFGVLTAGSVPASQNPDAGTSDCSNAECNGAFYSEILRQYGAGSAEWIPLDLDRPSAAEDAALAQKVRGMTGFFLGGGDQSRYTSLLFRQDGKDDTALLAAIRAAVEGGAVIAGTSAGAAVLQGSPMITGGESYYGVREGSSSSASDNPDRLTYRANGGFGIFTAGLVDTHFAARGRQGRIVRLAADTNQRLAFGVDEDTVLISTGTSLSVLGRRSVHILDLQSGRVTNTSGWGISNVRWSTLHTGDNYDVTTSRITRAAGTTAYEGKDQTATYRSTDIFSSPDAPSNNDGRAAPYEMVKLAEDLVSSRRSRSTEAETWETDPAFLVSLTIGSSFSGWRSSSGAISFQNMTVDISRA